MLILYKFYSLIIIHISFDKIRVLCNYFYFKIKLLFKIIISDKFNLFLIIIYNIKFN